MAYFTPDMHILQQKILDLSRRENIRKLSYAEMGRLLNEPHSQNVKHHLGQLMKKGFLKITKGGHSIIPADEISNTNNFLSIPIVGMASCGPALTLAQEQIEGYLQVSKSTIPQYKPDSTFAVKPIGNSMNNAQIGEERLSLEEGDYAIIEKRSGSISDFNNQYVLSIIDGMANIKKFTYDEKQKRIVLKSESKQTFPPIIIHESDLEFYMVNGIVKTVIKA